MIASQEHAVVGPGRPRSPRQVAASRNNGKLSRGPTTAVGKARSSRNAVTHGLFAVLPRQPLPVFCERQDYDKMVAAMLAEFGCRTTMGAALVQGLAADVFRLQHVRGMEAAVLSRGATRNYDLDAAIRDRDFWARHRSDAENLALLQGLESTREALRHGLVPDLDANALGLVVEDLWRAMTEDREEVERQAQELKDCDAGIQAGLPEVPEDLTAYRRRIEESINAAKDSMTTRDHTVFGVTCRSDLTAVLSGDHGLVEADGAKLVAFVEDQIAALKANMQRSADAQARIDDIRGQTMLASVAKLPEIELIGDYEDRLRRQIAKSVTMIKEVESLAVIDV